MLHAEQRLVCRGELSDARPVRAGGKISKLTCSLNVVGCNPADAIIWAANANVSAAGIMG